MRRSGFSLLELLLATALLVGGVGAIVFAFSRGLVAAADAEAMEQGLHLAQERLERIRGAAFGAIVSEPKAPIPGWTGFSRRVRVTRPRGTDGNLKQAMVTVYWRFGGREVSDSLTTYVVNR